MYRGFNRGIQDRSTSTCRDLIVRKDMASWGNGGLFGLVFPSVIFIEHRSKGTRI